MSIYFETRNDDGGIQINDINKTVGFVRSGTIRACISRGELYGFELTKNEIFAAFSVDNGTLYISPYIACDNSKICYVGSREDVDIHYYVYATSNDFRQTSKLGLQIFDKNSSLIYDAFHLSLSVVEAHDFVCSGEYESSKLVEIAAVLAVSFLPQGHPERIDGTVDNYINSGSCPSFSTKIKDGYAVASFSTPWNPRLAIYNTSYLHKVYMGGYVFNKANKTLSIETKKQCFTANRLYGSGSWSHLVNPIAQDVGFYIVGGICANQYLFSIVDTHGGA